MTEEDVERVAKTLYEDRPWPFKEQGQHLHVPWEHLDGHQGEFRSQAFAVLSALEAAGWRKVEEGFVVVPRDATEEMVNAGFDNKSVGSPTIVYQGIWRDMLAAATSSS